MSENKVHIQNSLESGRGSQLTVLKHTSLLKEKLKDLRLILQDERKDVMHLGKEKWKTDYVAERWILLNS